MELFNGDYDQKEWRIESFPSGTVIVCTGDPKLSHFYVYGPKIDPEDARARLRYRYATELVEFLNNGTLPKWLNFENAVVDFNSHNVKWEDGTDITCVSHLCGEEQASDLFYWFLEQRQAAQGAEQLAEMIDADILKKMQAATIPVTGEQFNQEKLTVEKLQQVNRRFQEGDYFNASKKYDIAGRDEAPGTAKADR